MKQIMLLMVAGSLLAACGVDGEPVAPARPSVTTNIGIGDGGVSTNVGIHTQIGPVGVGIGL